MLHRFPQESLVHLAEYRIRQRERAHLLTVQIHNINICHLLLLPPVCSPALKLMRRKARSATPQALLALAAGLLGSLQRIDCAGSGKSTTLARRSFRLRNQHIAFAGPRYCAFHHQQVLFEIDSTNAQIANRHLLRAHVARHALPWKHARRKAGSANRALHLEHVSVRFGSAAKSVTPYYARETAALRSADHIHKLRIA